MVTLILLIWLIFLKLNEEYFVSLLSLKNGIPSHYFFARIFSIIDSKQFMTLFMEVVKKGCKQ